MTPTLQLVDPEDRDRLIHILESSLDVCKASQFFAWTQGPLQSLLPHEILICGLTDPLTQQMGLRYFTATRYFRQEHFDAACNVRSGLISKVIQHWRVTRQPLLVPDVEGGPGPEPDWPELLTRLELRNMVCHGQVNGNGEIQAWFGFFRVPTTTSLTPLLLKLLMPCLAAIYPHMLASESGQITATARLGNPLSGREIQVLELVLGGQSNAEIAERLGLSAMTAKNHMQNIRRKLRVKTRAQAVAEALRLGLIQPGRVDS